MKVAYYFLFGLVFLAALYIRSEDMDNSVNNKLAGSLLKARHTDFFENTILNGAVRAPKEYKSKDWSLSKNYDFNATAYEKNYDLGHKLSYIHYKSAVRIHFYFISVLEDIFYNATGEAKNRIKIYKILFSIINTLVLFLFLVWVYREFGIYISMLVGAFFIIDPMVFIFGFLSNWWMNFLPFLYALFAFQNNDSLRWKHLITLCLLVCLSSLVSYEMMPTVMISCLIPLVYYAVKNQIGLRSLSINALKYIPMIVLGLVLGIFIHILILSSFEGSLELALDHLKQRFFVRTYDFNTDLAQPLNVAQEQGLKTPLSSVIKSFFQSSEGIYGITEYAYLIGIGLLLTISMIKSKIFKSLFKTQYLSFIALCIVSLIAFIGGLARVIIFKSHGAQEGHQEFLAMSFNVPYRILIVLLISFIIISIAKLLYRSQKEQAAPA